MPLYTPSDPTMGGDLTGPASNAQLAAGAIVDADINASAAISATKLDPAVSADAQWLTAR